MKIKKLFEELASRTWEVIPLTKKLNISYGEKSITSHNLLEISRRKYGTIRVIETPGGQPESKTGLDWEFWIQYKDGWRRFAVQAKKVKVNKTKYYYDFGYLVGTGASKKRQFDILKQYANANNSIPLYCLYNNLSLDPHASPHIDKKILEDDWRCSQEFEVEQLGCTFVRVSKNLEKIVYVVPGKGGTWSSPFQDIYKACKVYPWRCLLCDYGSIYSSCNRQDPPPLAEEEEVGYYSDLPPALRNAIQSGSFSEWPRNLYSYDLGHFPGQVFILENSRIDSL
ncbi:MAG: hypothetical protein HC795_09725 [Coleofasciculaceae cyanobacterium RL_1_1]|nr:hypothetical protein [Coleofasciculaceae cyanobacterium RL_1_1]